MKRRADLRLIKHVLDIRQAQQAAAEARVGEASSRLRVLEAQQDEASDAVARDQISWQGVVSGGTLDIGLAQAWAAEVLKGAEDLRQAQVRTQEAGRVRTERTDELKLAISRHEAAAGIRRSIRKAVRRREEEAALNAAADRFAQLRRKP